MIYASRWPRGGFCRTIGCYHREITGFVFMLGAETLYSIRKRARRFCYGQMSAWLQAQIFLGLAGAFFILLHSAGKFHGLAGAWDRLGYGGPSWDDRIEAAERGYV